MTDIDKVKELVEWAATGIEVEVCAKCGYTGEGCKVCPKLDGITSVAKQILSHPDLYIRDYNVEVEGLHDLYKAFIPLAPAIKEMR